MIYFEECLWAIIGICLPPTVPCFRENKVRLWNRNKRVFYKSDVKVMLSFLVPVRDPWWTSLQLRYRSNCIYDFFWIFILDNPKSLGNLRSNEFPLLFSSFVLWMKCLAAILEIPVQEIRIDIDHLLLQILMTDYWALGPLVDKLAYCTPVSTESLWIFIIQYLTLT